MLTDFDPKLLATCGMNCAVCDKHLRTKNTCPGCQFEGAGKTARCSNCATVQCASARGLTFCVDCADYPCLRIKRLDKSYKQRYNVSLIKEARDMRAMGETAYLAEQSVRWRCKQCGGVVSLHTSICSACGRPHAIN